MHKRKKSSLTVSGQTFPIVINQIKGIYTLSDQAIMWLQERRVRLPEKAPQFAFANERDHPELISLVMALGVDAGNHLCELVIVPVPIEMREYYYINSMYDNECIDYRHRDFVLAMLPFLHQENALEWKQYVDHLLQSR